MQALMPQAPPKKFLDHMRATLLLYGSGLRLMECVRRRVKEKLYSPVIPPGRLDSSSEARYNRHYHNQDSIESLAGCDSPKLAS